ncbi:exonuclease [Vibrio phage K406]
MSSFSKRAGKGSENSYNNDGVDKPKKEYVIDTGDNYLFKEIQVDNIEDLLSPDCIFYEDYDTAVYRAASMLQEKRIKAVCKEDPSITFDCKNVTEFKGRKRNDQVSDNSELGIFNVDRELTGKPLLKPSDFDIEEYQKLNGEEDKLLETAKIQLLKSMKNTCLQYGIPKIIPVLGHGSCFREDEPTARMYKGNRTDSLRPILLKKLRAWMIEERGAIDTSSMTHKGGVIECDDYIEIKASEGYRHYRKNEKFNIGIISSDKDSLNSPKLMVNRDTLPKKNKTEKAKLKFPKPMLIEATDRCAGDVVLISKENGKDFKGYGFKFLMYQAILGEDSADNYSAIRHLGKGLNFGDTAAYKVLKPCKTAKETLQATIDTMAELFPYGVQYEDWKGNTHDVDTVTYMDLYFRIAYMIRKLEDPMDFFKLCAAFKVDTSTITDNNKLTPPVRTFVGNEEEMLGIKDCINSILSDDLRGLKSLKKADAAVVIDRIKEKLESIDFESQYAMIQEEKA